MRSLAPPILVALAVAGCGTRPPLAVAPPPRQEPAPPTRPPGRRPTRWRGPSSNSTTIVDVNTSCRLCRSTRG